LHQEATRQTRHVQFSTVEVREYNLTIGDHPICESYPLALDWDYTICSKVPVDQCEAHYCHRLTSLARKIRIALVSGRSLQELSLQEASRITALNEADMKEWFNCESPEQELSSSFSSPMKTSANMYTMSNKCDNMDVSIHSEERTRHGASFDDSDDDDDSLLDFDDDEDFFEGF
jgi:hypothetical protein